MAEPRALSLEERDNGTVVVGAWPPQMRLDPWLLREITDVCAVKLGDEFTVELANGRAKYRYVDTAENGDLICAKIKRLS